MALIARRTSRGQMRMRGTALPDAQRGCRQDAWITGLASVTLHGHEARGRSRPVPVRDVDAAKDFYTRQAGFALDHDVSPGETMRLRK